MNGSLANAFAFGTLFGALLTMVVEDAKARRRFQRQAKSIANRRSQDAAINRLYDFINQK